MKIRTRFALAKIVSVALASMVLGACVAPPPVVSSASLTGAKRLAIVNIAQLELLMLGGRNNPSRGGNANGGAMGAYMVESMAINWEGNRREFNERAPTNLARDLQSQFTKSMQNEVAATGREATIVEITVPDRADKNYLPLMLKSIREKCASCDHALIINTAFGYTKGDRVLNPTAESSFLVARLTDTVITGETPFLIQRDFSNSAVGHEHYNDFRNDKRDHYALLRDLPAGAARAIAKELR